MSFRIAKFIFTALAIASLTSSAFGAGMNADAINSAEPSKKTMSSDKPSPAGVRLQVLLDRASFSQVRRECEESPARLRRGEAIAELRCADRGPLERAAGRRSAGDNELHHRLGYFLDRRSMTRCYSIRSLSCP